MSDEKLITVYLLYLKSENRLYAFTLEKGILKQFLKERNKKIFHVEKRKMDQTSLSLFMNKYHNRKIIDVPLFDGEQYISILGTAEEDNKVCDSSDYLFNEFIYCSHLSKNFPFRKKYLNLIMDLTNVVTLKETDSMGEVDEILQFDTFCLFMHLFRNTFIEESDENESIF